MGEHAFPLTGFVCLEANVTFQMTLTGKHSRVATLWERVVPPVYRTSSFVNCKFEFLIIFILVLIVSVPGHCLIFFNYSRNVQPEPNSRHEIKMESS